MAEKKILIDLAINDNDAVDKIVQAKAALEKLKQAQKQWKDELKAGNVSQDEYNAAMAKTKAQIDDLNGTVRANQKALLENIKARKQEGESLNAMRAQLKNMVAAYDEMNKAERESAQGQELLKHISDLTSEIKNMEYQQLIFKRNVGNYMSALEGLPFGKVIAGFSSLSGGTLKMSNAFKNAGLMAKSFGKELLALAANPIVLAIGAIVTVLAKLVKEFKKNDDAMTALSKAFAAFQPILDLVNKAINVLVGGLTKALTAMTNLINKIPGFGDAAKTAEDIIQGYDDLEEAERQYTVNSAKRDAQIADLRDKAADKVKYTAEQRIKFNKQALEAEEKNFLEEKNLAKRRYELALQAQKRDNDFSDERKNEIAQLEADMYRVDAAYADAHRRLQREQNRFVSEIQAEAKAEEQERQQRAKEWQARLKEMQKAELEAVRSLEDALIEQMDESLEKRLKQMKTQYKREIEDLQTRLKTETNLTAKARESINKLILIKQKELREKLVLEEAKYYAEVRQKIAESFSMSMSFMDTSRLQTDLQALTNAFIKSINEIDAAGKEATHGLSESFKAAFDSAAKQGDSLAKAINRMLSSTQDSWKAFDVTNFRQTFNELAKFIAERQGKSIQEVTKTLESSDLYKELERIYKQYLKTVGDQSRQVNQMIIENTKKTALIVQKNILDAISNGGVTMYESWLAKQDETMQSMAKSIGANSLEQMKGFMSQIDTMISEQYALIAKYADDPKQMAFYREQIKALEELRGILFSNNESEKQALELRQKKVQAIMSEGNAQIELAKIDLEEKQSAKEKLEAQKAYLDSIKETVKTREEEYYLIRQSTADQREMLEKERMNLQSQLDAMQLQISLGVEVDQSAMQSIKNQIQGIVDQEKELTKQASQAAEALAATGFTSTEQLNEKINETVTAVMEANAEIAKSTKEINDMQIDSWMQTFNTIADAAGQLANAFGSLFTVLAEDNEEMQKYSNALAFTEIMINMASGIATAVAEGMKMGWPAAAVMIPVGIATVVAGIAQAISLFKQSDKVKKAPKFAQGGLVGERVTTRKDDTIHAKLSEGEYVIQSKIVKKYGVDFFDLLNGGKSSVKNFHFANGGVVTTPNTNVYNNTQNMDFNYSQLGDVFKEAVSTVQPVVSVREINDMQTRVNIKEQTSLL